MNIALFAISTFIVIICIGILILTISKLGRRVQLSPDWDEVRDEAMRRVLYAKFSQNEEFKQRLLATGDRHIIEDTTGWHDNYWGDCQCPRCKGVHGQNKLGMMLEEIRTKLR